MHVHSIYALIYFFNGQMDLAETDENRNENECGNENGNENENKKGKGRQDGTLCGIGRRSCK